MKKYIFLLFALVLMNNQLVSQEIAPYIKVGESTSSINTVYDQVIATLKSNEFMVIGGYSPANQSNLKVIVFTRNDLKNQVAKVADRGALAAAFKVGLVANNEKVTISYTNPEYILRAYLQDSFVTYKTTCDAFSSDLKSALSSLGSEFTPFGGGIKADKLKKYHYKIMMPYFTDPVELNEFTTFEAGLNIIEKNLKNNKGNTKLVYKLVYKKSKIAVFGIGLLDSEKGEPHFLPKIGGEHAAALPYEMILEDTKLTMLHGKYRIALHWPDLTMGQFMKIMSTPKDIKETMQALSEL